MSTNSSDRASQGGGSNGAAGEQHLAAGEHIAMRKWDGEEPGTPKPVSRRAYETIGYVLEGRAELHLGGKVTMLSRGSSWVVPHETDHTYRILERFSAIEVTHPSYREATGR
jgi:quercetin dioxygenase-like cupin family protein